MPLNRLFVRTGPKPLRLRLGMGPGWVFSVRLRILAFTLALVGVLVGTNLLHHDTLLHSRALDEQELDQRNRFETLQSVMEALGALRSELARLQVLVVERQQEPVSRTLDTVDARLGSYAEAVAALRRQNPDLAQRIAGGLDAIPQRARAGVAVHGTGNLPEFERLMMLNAHDFVEVEQRIRNASTDERRQLDTLRARNAGERERRLRIAGGLVATAGAIGLLVLLLVLQQVVFPLHRLSDSLRRLRLGELDAPLPLPSADEFGEMTLALRQFQAHARRLDFLAYTDPLTELPNRTRLDQVLPDQLERHDEQALPLALMFLGLDHFKSVNDSLGHGAGDRYLREAADRLRRLAPPQAQLFRYSGDEFALLLPQQRSENLTEQLRATAETVLTGMSAATRIDAQTLSMSVSMGIAVYPEDATTAGELVSSADAAMFQAKAGGRNQLRFATRELTASVRQRMLLAGEVHSALEANEFDVHFQPIVDVERGQVLCAEVLMRWYHPRRGLIMPGEFVPAAEESGAITALGRYCLERSCAQLGRFSAAGRRLRASVNLSARQLYEPHFVDSVRETLQRHALEPALVEFEITESVMMERPEDSARVLRALRELGVGLCIDDFGTGYSSLSYVQNFPIQKIKIDRSFVNRLTQSREAEAIVLATLSMARSLKLEVVAEGVETVAQMRRLFEMGCSLQQGFLFTPALPAREFEYWLEMAPKRLDEIAPS